MSAAYQQPTRLLRRVRTYTLEVTDSTGAVREKLVISDPVQEICDVYAEINGRRGPGVPSVMSPQVIGIRMIVILRLV